MKANADKCHLLVTGNYEVSVNINDFEIESSKKEKLLGISNDTRLSFEYHITSLFKQEVQMQWKSDIYKSKSRISV